MTAIIPMDLVVENVTRQPGNVNVVMKLLAGHVTLVFRRDTMGPLQIVNVKDVNV